jgi:hypothetical protein
MTSDSDIQSLAKLPSLRTIMHRKRNASAKLNVSFPHTLFPLGIPPLEFTCSLRIVLNFSLLFISLLPVLFLFLLLRLFYTLSSSHNHGQAGLRSRPAGHLIGAPTYKSENRRSDFVRADRRVDRRIDASLNIVKSNKTHDNRRGLPPLDGRLDSWFPRDFGAARKVVSTHQSMVDSGRVHMWRSQTV